MFSGAALATIAKAEARARALRVVGDVIGGAVRPSLHTHTVDNYHVLLMHIQSST